jgi:hypothetical protein
MFGGVFGNNDKNAPGYEDEYKKSILSDIKSFFGSISYKGGVGSGSMSGMAITLNPKE